MLGAGRAAPRLPACPAEPARGRGLVLQSSEGSSSWNICAPQWGRCQRSFTRVFYPRDAPGAPRGGWVNR